MVSKLTEIDFFEFLVSDEISQTILTCPYANAVISRNFLRYIILNRFSNFYAETFKIVFENEKLGFKFLTRLCLKSNCTVNFVDVLQNIF